MTDNLELLEQVSEKLSSKGKKLIVYSAPSKCEYTEKHIPQKYKDIRADKNYKTSAIDYFNDRVSDYNITYISYKPLLSDLSYPVFYKNGIHWSRPAEQTVSREVIREINKSEGNVKPLNFTGVYESDKEIFREEDLIGIANLWFGTNETYYEYKTEELADDVFNRPVIIIQGDSFSEGLFKDIQDNRTTDVCYHIFYSDFIKDIDGNIISDTRDFKDISEEEAWDRLDAEGLVEKADVICLEFCSTYMNLQSSGFAGYLNRLLAD